MIILMSGMRHDTMNVTSTCTTSVRIKTRDRKDHGFQLAICMSTDCNSAQKIKRHLCVYLYSTLLFCNCVSIFYIWAQSP